MCTIHTLGGEEMMREAVKAAREEAKKLGKQKPLILGITVLTSDKGQTNTGEEVLKRAELAYLSELDGVVASCEEAPSIRKKFGSNFVIVTPGIRPTGADAGDQKRVATPTDAVKSGSNFLVVGRPILKAANPLKAAKDILKEIA
jgi:orotidine-5'-phosphate decarboxylase